MKINFLRRYTTGGSSISQLRKIVGNRTLAILMLPTSSNGLECRAMSSSLNPFKHKIRHINFNFGS
ncbi:MAG TPA: hypothetical protein DD706_19390 [Nitrospiraceae bacterium]|nr:hypothetical protein [Nitrospiraceae bacterium]